MAEAFIFTSGNGVLNLDGTNYSVTAGSVSLVFPPVRHTIFNIDPTQPLELFTVASIP